MRYWCQVPLQFVVHFIAIPGLPEISRKYLDWLLKDGRKRQKDRNRKTIALCISMLVMEGEG